MAATTVCCLPLLPAVWLRPRGDGHEPALLGGELQVQRTAERCHPGASCFRGGGASRSEDDGRVTPPPTPRCSRQQGERARGTSRTPGRGVRAVQRPALGGRDLSPSPL